MRPCLVLPPFVCAIVMLAGCDNRASAPQPVDTSKIEPADRALTELYDHSCKACHAVPESGAPQTHDHAAWDPRWAKGLPTLLDHAVQGFQAMPAGGQCNARRRIIRN